jgi:hypothetical protein
MFLKIITRTVLKVLTTGSLISGRNYPGNNEISLKISKFVMNLEILFYNLLIDNHEKCRNYINHHSPHAVWYPG